MAVYFTPHVRVTETDKSLTVQRGAASNVGLVIGADWGPCNQIIQIPDQAELVRLFDEPNRVDQVKLIVADASSFSAGGPISGGTSSASAKIVSVDTVNNLIYVKNVSGGPFQAGENLDNTETYVGAETTCTSVHPISSAELSWMVANEFCNNYANSGYAVRTITDAAASSCNSILIANADAEIARGWDLTGTDKNGTAQILRINEDDAEPSVNMINLTKLTVADTSDFTVGGDISSDNDDPGAAKVFHIESSTVLYIKDVSGTFADGDNLDNVAVFVGAETTLTTNNGAQGQVVAFYAKYPGKGGNKISVAMTDSTNFASATITGSYTFANQFSQVPSSGELAIAVLWDGVIVEKHIVSITENAKNLNNKVYYIEDWLENESNYIYAIASTSGDSQLSDFAGNFTASSLTGGMSDFAAASIQTAYDLIFGDEEYNIKLVGDFHDLSDADVKTIHTYMKTKAELYKRHLAVAVLPQSAIDMSSFSITDVTTHMTGCTGSSYFAMYDEWKKVLDKWNNKKYFVPCTADALGMIVKALDVNSWTAPSGNDFVISNVLSLYHKTTETVRDSLHLNGVNSIWFKRRIGYVCWGQVTTYNQASSRSRINVRLNLLDLEEAIADLLDNFIGSASNEETWRQIRNAVDEGYLKPRDGKGAFDSTDGVGYRFVCDSTNNTADKRDAYTIVCDLAVKPVKAAEVISFNVVIAASGTKLEEL